jgi:hypothetical protein
MSQSRPVVVEPQDNNDALGLLERLDPAIGEATSVVGAMLSELLRRTLRGGVARIGDEMHGYVSDKVDTAIAERTPGLEQLAAEVAEHAARTAATEVATEEVHALEKRTLASDLELAGKITEAARAAETSSLELAGKISETARAAEQLAESAEALTAQIKDTEQRTLASDLELAGKISETARTAEVSDRELAGKISETARAAEQLAKESAEALAAQIKDTEQRSQAALDEQVRTLVERSRERSDRLKARLTERDKLIASLNKQLDSLTARVAELEKPRGLRALWLRMFGRRNAKAAEPVVAD